MKIVRLDRDFTFKPKRNVHIVYRGGVTYERVPESAVRAIVKAGAGAIVPAEKDKA